MPVSVEMVEQAQSLVQLLVPPPVPLLGRDRTGWAPPGRTPPLGAPRLRPPHPQHPCHRHLTPHTAVLVTALPQWKLTGLTAQHRYPRHLTPHTAVLVTALPQWKLTGLTPQHRYPRHLTPHTAVLVTALPQWKLTGLAPQHRYPRHLTPQRVVLVTALPQWKLAPASALAPRPPQGEPSQVPAGPHPRGPHRCCCRCARARRQHRHPHLLQRPWQAPEWGRARAPRQRRPTSRRSTCSRCAAATRPSFPVGCGWPPAVACKYLGGGAGRGRGANRGRIGEGGAHTLGGYCGAYERSFVGAKGAPCVTPLHTQHTSCSRTCGHGDGTGQK